MAQSPLSRLSDEASVPTKNANTYSECTLYIVYVTIVACVGCVATILFTARLHAMQRTVLRRLVCSHGRLSVNRVHCNKTKLVLPFLYHIKERLS